MNNLYEKILSSNGLCKYRVEVNAIVITTRDGDKQRITPGNLVGYIVDYETELKNIAEVLDYMKNV